MIKELSIFGFRGFSKKQTFKFAIPDGKKDGSGLTVLVGANNAGKTTVIEAIRAFNTKKNEAPSFSEGRRNSYADRRVELTVIDENDSTYKIATVKEGGSSTIKEPANFELKAYVMQSRRHVDYEFREGTFERDQYIQLYQKLGDSRSSSLNQFSTRIFQIQKNREHFDFFLEKVFGKQIKWTIEKRDSGLFYVQFSDGSIVHSSEGVGDGIWSVFTICDALYDAKDKSTIVIDEPELSIHPTLQKRLMKLLLEQSRTKQIIICTHSAHFVNWKAITEGSGLIRMVKEDEGSTCYHISQECAEKFAGILRDLNNPHTLGLDATEALFLDDKIILVEGQEDVVIFDKLSEELNIPIEGTFFGWGVGGASKMSAMLHLFHDLGYKSVVAIFDGDKATDAEKSQVDYPDYRVIILPQDDIRDKPPCTRKDVDGFPCYRPKKEGLVTEKGKVKEGTTEQLIQLLNSINTALKQCKRTETKN